MKKKVYIGTDDRKLPFICLKKGNWLIAVDPVRSKNVSYGKIDLDLGLCQGGTHCFEGLFDEFESLRKKDMGKPKFYQAVLQPIKDIVAHVYPDVRKDEITIAERMGDENATCPECGENHWILSPVESVAVREGGKAYMECMNCGYQTHF